MERLTHKKEDWYWKDEEFWLSAENPSLEKVDEIYYKLAEFEDFMEEQGFDSLDELKSKLNKKFYIYNDDVRQGKVFNGVFFSYDQLIVMDEWAEFNTDYFKKYLDSQKENQALKDKIQELELAELIRKKEK